MNIIKVLHVISDTNIGGAGKYLINYCNNRNKDEFDVSILLPSGSALVPHLEKSGVNLIQIDGLKDNSKDFKSYKLIKNMINEIKPDIVHTHASIVARIAAKKSKCKPKVIYTKHCDFEPSKIYNHKIVKFLFNKFTKKFADRIIATSEPSKQNLIKQGIDANIIEAISNGCDGYNRYSDEQIKKIKAQYGLRDEFIIGYVARLVELKGHKFLFDALNELKESVSNFKCLIIGDGEYKEELERYVKELEIEQYVLFTGFIENVEEILNIIDVQVNCSYLSETTNLALLEGMSLGIPTVAFSIGGLPYMIKDDYNGYIVPIKDYKALSDKIMTIMNDHNLYEKMKDNSINCFKENYTSQKFAKSIEDVYRRVK